MTPWDLFIHLLFVGLCLILLAVSAVSYRRFREARLAFVTGAFLLYSVVAVVALLSGIFEWEGLSMGPAMVLLNVGVLLCLYASLIRR